MYSPISQLRNLTGIVAAAVLVLAAMAGPAWADPADPTPPSPGPWGWGGNVGDGGQTPGPPGQPERGGSDDAGGQPAGDTSTEGGCPDATPANTGCDAVTCGPLGGIAGCQPPGTGGVPAVTPVELLQQAIYELGLPRPTIRTAPPRGTEGVVGLAQWFWLDPAQRKPKTVRRSAGSVWVELTASPQTMTIHPGTGFTPVTCPDSGTAYRPGATASAPSCSFPYTRSSATEPGNVHRVTATVSWGGTWHGSGGVGGSLVPIAVNSVFPIRIAEGQALNGGGQ